VRRTGEITIVTAGGLRAVEVALTGVDPGRTKLGHVLSPEGKSKAPVTLQVMTSAG
jgi:hypothetical protein